MNVHRRDQAKMLDHDGATGQKLVGAAPAADKALAHAAALEKYAVLYPIYELECTARAVLIPSGDVLLSTPLELVPAHQVELELRLWWP
jgi:hypothetical protein